ncbi:hypothetical protein [Streptomyces avermitilis]
MVSTAPTKVHGAWQPSIGKVGTGLGQEQGFTVQWRQRVRHPRKR